MNTFLHSTRTARKRLLHCALLLALALVCGLLTPLTVRAQKGLIARIKAIQDVPLWQRERRSSSELRRLLKGIQSSKQATRDDAFEKLALSRPVPALADVVIQQANGVARATRDKFATSMAFEIKRVWGEAKKAAETLQLAQRNGGLRYLEQVIVRGNAAQAGGPLIAAAYSGNSRAVRLVTQNWRKSKIPGKRALEIIGPPAAPDLIKQLGGSDRFTQRDLIEVLGQIGTDKQLLQLKQAAAKADPNMSRMINAAISKIERRAAESKSAKTSKKKSKKKSKAKKAM